MSLSIIWRLPAGSNNAKCVGNGKVDNCRAGTKRLLVDARVASDASAVAHESQTRPEGCELVSFQTGRRTARVSARKCESSTRLRKCAIYCIRRVLNNIKEL